MEKCAICHEEMNDMSEERKIYQLPECKHSFHLECVITWWRSPRDYYDSRKYGECPLCRGQQKKNISWRTQKGRVSFFRRMARKKNVHPALLKVIKKLREEEKEWMLLKKKKIEFSKRDDVRKIILERRRLRDDVWRQLKKVKKIELEVASFDPLSVILI